LYLKNQFEDIRIKDLDRDDGFIELDVLNVCIPAIVDFENIVISEAKTSFAKLVIIHSTIEVGTTERIQARLISPVAHSPVRGVHPNLLDGILTFDKFVGAKPIEHSRIAAKHLESLGVKAKILESSRETELGKLLDTTYYGVCISWHAEMKKMCDHHNVNFDDAVTKFNETYNEGYRRLGKPKVVRPVLYPPTEFIGGHCVVPNAKILQKTFRSEGLEMILKYSREN